MIWMITLEKKYCNAILDGRKKFELRTRIPKNLAAGDTVLVCEKGSKGIVPFYFVIDAIAVCSPLVMWSVYHHRLAIDEADYLKYTKGRKFVYGLRIRYVYRYNYEVNISDFGVPRAPQWFSVVPCGKTALIVGSSKGD